MKLSNDAQAVIIKQDEEGALSFLVIKRFDKDKQTDHYRLVKGGVEQNETSEQAAIREVGEEVGINDIIRSDFLCHYGYVGGEIRHEVDVYLIFVDPRDTEVSVDSRNEGGFTIKNAAWLSSDDAITKLTFEDEKKLIVESVEKLAI